MKCCSLDEEANGPSVSRTAHADEVAPLCSHDGVSLRALTGEIYCLRALGLSRKEGGDNSQRCSSSV